MISWLQSPSAVILEPKKIKSSTVSPSICHEVTEPHSTILVFFFTIEPPGKPKKVMLVVSYFVAHICTFLCDFSRVLWKSYSSDDTGKVFRMEMQGFLGTGPKIVVEVVLCIKVA